MLDTPLVMYDEDLRRVLAVAQRLVKDFNFLAWMGQAAGGIHFANGDVRLAGRERMA